MPPLRRPPRCRRAVPPLPPPPPPAPAVPAPPPPPPVSSAASAASSAAAASPRGGDSDDSEASDSTAASAAGGRRLNKVPPPPPPLAEPWQVLRSSSPLQDDPQVSARVLAQLLAEADHSKGTFQPPAQEWLPFGRAPPSRSSELDRAADKLMDLVNIFTINDASALEAATPSSSSSAAAPAPGRGVGLGRGAGAEVGYATVADSGGASAGWHLSSMFGTWAPMRPQAPRIRPLGQRLRSKLDPSVRKGRREVRKWRRRHEIFVVLNDMERCLGEASRLLLQASASMRRFGDSHGGLGDAPLLSAFLCDAALYYKSEAEVPSRVEAHLSELERVADDFRNVAVAATGDAVQNTSAPGIGEVPHGGCDPGDESLRRQSIDLQIDIAVLLESALMAAQQALAEYKKMHCRLELLATEYQPLCQLELDISARPAFLPLLADETTKAEAASLPERVVQWAADFSQLVGNSSRGLECLVRELDRRRRRLSGCAAELRDILLRRAAAGGGGGESLSLESDNPRLGAG
mmetsp:Transcript_63902/g.208373  ORF Transcript_63902/g.208373 Transcript_63902/m.208373 type:complete len:521 (+) Transcript_63902:736-2298(+)